MSQNSSEMQAIVHICPISSFDWLRWGKLARAKTIYRGVMRYSEFINRVLIPSVGGAIGILCMVAFDRFSTVPLFMVPFATSIVLVMATPLSLFARPQNIIGGHLLSAAAGFLVLWTLGSNPWLAAPAVGIAIALMQMTGTLHPPAGLNPFIIVTLAPEWTFFFIPIGAGAVLLVVLAWAYHKITQPGVYPIRKINKS